MRSFLSCKEGGWVLGQVSVRVGTACTPQRPQCTPCTAMYMHAERCMPVLQPVAINIKVSIPPAHSCRSLLGDFNCLCTFHGPACKLLAPYAWWQVMGQYTRTQAAEQAFNLSMHILSYQSAEILITCLTCLWPHLYLLPTTDPLAVQLVPHTAHCACGTLCLMPLPCASVHQTTSKVCQCWHQAG